MAKINLTKNRFWTSNICLNYIGSTRILMRSLYTNLTRGSFIHLYYYIIFRLFFRSVRVASCRSVQRSSVSDKEPVVADYDTTRSHCVAIHWATLFFVKICVQFIDVSRISKSKHLCFFFSSIDARQLLTNRQNWTYGNCFYAAGNSYISQQTTTWLLHL